MACCGCKCGMYDWPIEVGSVVHSNNTSYMVRLNGAMTIVVEYLSDHVVVLSLSGERTGTTFYSEKSMTRKEFDAEYEMCSCPSRKACRL